VSVIAYRTWNVETDGQLAAVATRARWDAEQVVARCAAGHTRRFHLPPNPSCRCGIYAWKRPIDPDRIDQWTQASAERVAVGVVRLWGRMCDGAGMTGYRAQYARVVALVGDGAGRLDRTRYPSVRFYPDLATMYGDWDVMPELGFAADAPEAAARAKAVRDRAADGCCLACGRELPDGGAVVYGGRNPWVGGGPVAVRLHRDACPVFLQEMWSVLSRERFDREWAYANRQSRRLAATPA
jgi:hypothetical protein